MPASPPNAVEKAMRLLAMRALSECELRTKLSRAGYSDIDIENALEVCRSRRFIDDTMLAADYVEVLRQRNIGSRAIRFKLAKRGLADEIIEGNLPEEDSETAEENAARRALEGKWRLLDREADQRKKREKAFRFMAGRGFAPSLIFKLLNEISSDGEEL